MLELKMLLLVSLWRVKKSKSVPVFPRVDFPPSSTQGGQVGWNLGMAKEPLFPEKQTVNSRQTNGEQMRKED